MSVFYLPGCHFAKYDPQASKALIAFTKEYLHANILGCCSKQYDKPNAGDTVIYVCPTCSLIMSEANPSAKLISLYEVLLIVLRFVKKLFLGLLGEKRSYAAGLLAY